MLGDTKMGVTIMGEGWESDERRVPNKTCAELLSWKLKKTLLSIFQLDCFAKHYSFQSMTGTEFSSLLVSVNPSTSAWQHGQQGGSWGHAELLLCKPEAALDVWHGHRRA